MTSASVRTLLRTFAWRVAPSAMADRARDYERALRNTQGVTDLAVRFMTQHGDRVLHGPVAGLRMVAERISEVDMPTAKLLGTYEKEIHPALEEALAAGARRFVDLGSADGYFAVGIARRGIPVDAFDLSRGARDLLAATARLNGVEHLISQRGEVTQAAVLSLDLAGALVLCDIEGFERQVFTPALLAALSTSPVVIELHEKPNPDVVEVLVNRFASTHQVEVLEATQRDPNLHAELDVFDDAAERLHAIDERYRTDGRRWAVCRPVTAAAA